MRALRRGQAAEGAAARRGPSRQFLGGLLCLLVTATLLSTRRWGGCAHGPRAATSQQAARALAHVASQGRGGGREKHHSGCAGHCACPQRRMCARALADAAQSGEVGGTLLVSRRTPLWDRLHAEGLYHPSSNYPRVPMSEEEAGRLAEANERVLSEWPGGARRPPPSTPRPRALTPLFSRQAASPCRTATSGACPA